MTEKPTITIVCKQATEICKLAWPVSLGYLLQMSLGLASVFTLGHVGTNELAAAALGSMFANVTGFSIGIGLAAALDTLCSQAYTAAENKHILGFHLQRGLFIMLLITPLISLLWVFTESLLLLLEQDPIGKYCECY